MGVGDKVYIADKQTLDEVNVKVGKNTDAAGTGSLFAWLKKSGDAITALTNSYTALRAGYLDRLDVALSSRSGKYTRLTTGTLKNVADTGNTGNNWYTVKSVTGMAGKLVQLGATGTWARGGDGYTHQGAYYKLRFTVDGVQSVIDCTTDLYAMAAVGYNSSVGVMLPNLEFNNALTVEISPFPISAYPAIPTSCSATAVIAY